VRFGPTLSKVERAHCLTAIAALRAGQAKDISLLKRIGWVRDTLDMLDEAKRLTDGQMHIARWMSGRSACPTARFAGRGQRGNT
jgi:hypothetical protein